MMVMLMLMMMMMTLLEKSRAHSPLETTAGKFYPPPPHTHTLPFSFWSLPSMTNLTSAVAGAEYLAPIDPSPLLGAMQSSVNYFGSFPKENISDFLPLLPTKSFIWEYFQSFVLVWWVGK